MSEKPEDARGQAILRLPPELAGLGKLPVRVRDAAGRLTATGLSDEPIALEDGAYQISVQLPGGEERFADTLLEISGEGLVTAALDAIQKVHSTITDALAPAVAAAHDTAGAVQDLLGGIKSMAGLDDLAGMAMAASAALPQSAGARPCRIWSGHWLQPMDDVKAAFRAGLAEPFDLAPDQPHTLHGEDAIDRFLVLNHTQFDEKMIRLTVIPWDERLSGQAERSARKISATLVPGSDPPAIRYRSLEDSETNSLLDFLDSGVLSDMTPVSIGFIRDAAELIDRDGVSLLRGLLASYIMLRSNTLDGLELWLDRLAERAPSVPDVHALQVEVQARLGNHDRAVASLIDALGDDCPWFRSGLTYLYERLTYYLGLPAAKQTALPGSKDDWERMKAARRRIGALAPYFATSQVFTTFDIAE